MTTSAMDASLAWLQTVSGVHSESLQLREPFLDVVRRFAHLPGTVALLSGGKLDCARYDILGVYPWLSLSGHRTRTTLVEQGRHVEIEGNPFATLQHLLQHCGMPGFGMPGSDLPLPLQSGLLGYLAYDLKDCLEQLPRTSVDDLGLPLMYLVAPSILAIHDRVTEETTLLALRLRGDDAAFRQDLARFKAALAEPPAPAVPSEPA
ncbi:MAG TPA: aminodeoxychorismate synthase, component I, partial [Polyangiaceae bacterium]|nr:aminodeoxychorismate synthase, component I [Polyangiaceae bacterium]